jgi:hypothetical protein
MRVRLLVRLTGNYGESHEPGTEFILGNKIRGDNLSKSSDNRWNLWDIGKTKCVIPYARESWYEVVL